MKTIGMTSYEKKHGHDDERGMESSNIPLLDRIFIFYPFHVYLLSLVL
jgi:hypothetical protein